MDRDDLYDLSGHRVVVPGGSGTVGTGVVDAYLAAGATVVVPVRAAEQVESVKAAHPDHAGLLHVIHQDYGSFESADQLAREVELLVGGVDSVVAPIGGWWQGPPLTDISSADWQSALVSPLTAHAAVLQALLARMTDVGAYVVIVGDSYDYPVAGSGLVSMEQAALMMLQRVTAAETAAARRVFAFVLGQVITDASPNGTIAADQVGRVAVAASALPRTASSVVPLHDRHEADRARARFADA